MGSTLAAFIILSRSATSATSWRTMFLFFDH
jgi:hypothetical protein